MSAPTVTTLATVHLFKAQTNLRTGCSTRGPDNLIAKLPPGDYKPLHQCTGQDVSEGGDKNFWWVKIQTTNHGAGWVSAINISIGGDNEPIPGVEQRPTVNV